MIKPPAFDNLDFYEGQQLTCQRSRSTLFSSLNHDRSGWSLNVSPCFY